MVKKKIYEMPVRHIGSPGQPAQIRWFMNVWEPTAFDFEQLDHEFDPETVTKVWEVYLDKFDEPPMRLVETKVYKSKAMAIRWFRRYQSD